ncbi:hypothetical protein AIOL_002658 [Candidatus Rhodobacter oscarellae]|uniref:Uncharacterized protein n=1 Tax=Candidatus Rhodobacter oscarellae TaxID=1675527 RepID=A0A0J9E4N1_9RHOB|nr:hypothetical protein AIOL_002658 [Candidatus Rhodobacter lobularis]
MPPRFITVEACSENCVAPVEIIKKAHRMVEHLQLLFFVCAVYQVGRKLDKRVNAGRSA